MLATTSVPPRTRRSGMAKLLYSACQFFLKQASICEPLNYFNNKTCGINGKRTRTLEKDKVAYLLMGFMSLFALDQNIYLTGGTCVQIIS